MTTDLAATAHQPAGASALALRPARTLVRWGVRHGLPAVFLRRGARRGDPVGRLLRDPAVRDEPYGLYEQIRALGPVSPGSIGLVTPRTRSPRRSCAPTASASDGTGRRRHG
ncbi:hypothetical protein [Blastococcus brunescens]|uniref:Uncharacterized protein n=1 Tax=Blastococcus brunescens TaxID=1564165 RepID=A0ABZ1AYN0_9ACTN|nr:hypothetical protein [Blastococcus sp. BMG 8361]WRL63242.1 hypothetical protein U6N30_26285 [Blastococcus sp. BMG 8361]